ncbi:MAG: lipopolysaccharide heptosyltransferase II [Candidatus Omnitrophica bacterium]|nr:lipopolysaccharide heptosyltransferase II [Candidatus Omnitrophota bacterium]
MKKILIVTVNWLGDALMMTPALQALKENFPSCWISVMGVERVAPVFQDNPYVDEIIVFDERTQHRSLSAKLHFIRGLRKKRFDTVFLIQRSFTRALVCFLAGIPTRIGYYRRKYLGMVNKQITPPHGPQHRQDHYLSLFEESGVAVRDRNPQFFLTEEVRAQMKTRIKGLHAQNLPIVGIHPSANWLLKRWPPDYFAALCDRLIKEFNYTVIFIGARKDAQTVEKVISLMRNAAYNFCGTTTIKELGALLENMELFISNDSGPAHLAAALEVPTLVLFGPTSDAVTAPKGKSVRILKKNVSCLVPCYNLACRDNHCMKDISVEDALAQVNDIIAKKSGA